MIALAVNTFQHALNALWFFLEKLGLLKVSLAGYKIIIRLILWQCTIKESWKLNKNVNYCQQQFYICSRSGVANLFERELLQGFKIIRRAICLIWTMNQSIKDSFELHNKELNSTCTEDTVDILTLIGQDSTHQRSVIAKITTSPFILLAIHFFLSFSWLSSVFICGRLTWSLRATRCPRVPCWLPLL